MSTERSTSRTVAEVLLRLLIGGIFIFAGVMKIQDPIVFTADIRNYRIVGDPWPAVIALGLPWLEILAGLGLVLRRPYAGSVTMILVMLLVFLGALISALVRGLDIECGCFGGGWRTSVQTELMTVSVLLLLTLALIPLSRARGQRRGLNIDGLG